MRTNLARAVARPHDPVMFEIGKQDHISVIHPNQMISQSFHILPSARGGHIHPSTTIDVKGERNKPKLWQALILIGLRLGVAPQSHNQRNQQQKHHRPHQERRARQIEAIIIDKNLKHASYNQRREERGD